MGQANTKAKKIAIDVACIGVIGASIILIPGVAPLAICCKIGCFAAAVGFRSFCHEDGITLESVVESAVFCGAAAACILYSPKMVTVVMEVLGAILYGFSNDGSGSDTCGAHTPPGENTAFSDLGLTDVQKAAALTAAGQLLYASWQTRSLPSPEDILDALKNNLPTVDLLLSGLKCLNLSRMMEKCATVVMSLLLTTAAHRLSKSEWIKNRSHIEQVIVMHVVRYVKGELLSRVLTSFTLELIEAVPDFWAKISNRDRENLTRTALVRCTPNDGIYTVAPEALNFIKETIGDAPFKVVALMGPNADRSHHLKEFLESKGYAIDLPSPQSRRQTTGKPDIGVWAYALQRERLLILDSTESLDGFCLAVASHAVYSVCATTGTITDQDLDSLTWSFNAAYTVQNGWYTRSVSDREQKKQSLHFVSSKDFPPNPIVVSDSRRQEWQCTMKDFNVPTEGLAVPMSRWTDYDLSDVTIHHQCYRGNDDYWEFFNETFDSNGVCS